MRTIRKRQRKILYIQKYKKTRNKGIRKLRNSNRKIFKFYKYNLIKMKNNIKHTYRERDGHRGAVDSADQTPPSLCDFESIRTKSNNIKKWIYRYCILQDGKSVENNLIGWKTALAHARKWTTNLFKEVKKVEILNLWTGEIIDLQEAERRAKLYAQRV